MKSLVLPLFLGLLALPSAAQDAGDPRPLVLGLRTAYPLHALKDQVGDQLGAGVSLGYEWRSKSLERRSMTRTVKLEFDAFQGAQSLSLVEEHRCYANPGFQGAFLGDGVGLAEVVLKNPGRQPDVSHGGVELSLESGYRFANGWTVEAFDKAIFMDPNNCAINTVGLGGRYNF